MFNTPFTASPYYPLNHMVYCHYCNYPFLPRMHMQHDEWTEREINPIGEDHGKCPYVLNIDQATVQNENYRTVIWTGNHLQVTLMSIDNEIGLECHPDVDQFLRIEEGDGVVLMGQTKHNLNFERSVGEDDAIFVPAGTWHNVINTGKEPLKLYSIYAPPEHPFGTIHRTKADSDRAESYY